ncbi:MAG TPA: hypothetical protein VL362_02125 [Patescibacteria group bacterium]|jgi:Mrp family chromosome partitioning ATPase|nr:hypothetical protein [Patescibacteria group bacterium]
MTTPVAGGLQRPPRPEDESLRRAQQESEEQHRQAEERRAAAERARRDAEELEQAAADAEAEAERIKREAEGAAKDRELMAQANAQVSKHKRADRYESDSRYPDWALAGKPGRGPRLVLWWLWLVLRIYKISWVPQPRAVGLYGLRAAELNQSAIDNRSKSQKIVVVVTAKGGACKTTTSTWKAAIAASFSRLAVILFDTDSAGGKVLKRFRLNSEDAMTSTEVVKRGGNISYEELSRRTPTDPNTGVVMIHSPAGEEFEGDSLGVAVYNMHRASAHTLVVDCGAGFKKVNTDSVIKVADVIVIPADFGSGDYNCDDIEDVKETLDYKPYGLREEIGRVVIAVSAVKWRHFNTRTQYALARKFRVAPHQVVLIPYGRYFHKTGSVNLEKLRAKMLFAWALLNQRSDEAVIREGRRRLSTNFLDDAVVEEETETAQPQRLQSVHDRPARTAGTGWPVTDQSQQHHLAGA